MPEVLRAQDGTPTITEDREGNLVMVEKVFVKNCDGSTPQKRLYSALTAPGMPQRGDLADIPGVFCQHREAAPWGDTDAIVVLTFKGFPPIQDNLMGGIPQRVEIGVSLSQEETEFDADNRAKPFNQREPIRVTYQANGSTSSDAQTVTVPVLIPRPTYVFERWTTKNPGEKARKLVGRVNRDAWRGIVAEGALCTSITGVSTDGEKTWLERTEIAVDEIDKFRQVARYRDRNTGTLPELSKSDIESENGVKHVSVQSREDFNLLELPVNPVNA